MFWWFDIQFILFFGSALIAILLLAFYVCIKAITTPRPVIEHFDEERYYENPRTGTKEKFPSLFDNATIDLSIIVPAYDEEKRLPAMLDECLEHLHSSPGQLSWEIVIVSDGSHDKTVSVGQTYSEKYGTDKIRVMSLVKNRGKGGAVRLGMLGSRGNLLLFADADGATKFSDLDKLTAVMTKLNQHHINTECIVIGSRAHLEEKSIATRSIFRTILMHGFHLLVWLFAVRKIADTQCGFKLFNRLAARTLFPIMHVERWAFDVELLFLAQTHRIAIEEVAVQWTEIEGSKLTPIWSAIQMGRDLFLIWFRYTIGAWDLHKSNHN